MQFFNFNQTFLLRVRRILKELYFLKFDCDVVTLQYPVFYSVFVILFWELRLLIYMRLILKYFKCT